MKPHYPIGTTFEKLFEKYGEDDNNEYEKHFDDNEVYYKGEITEYWLEEETGRSCYHVYYAEDGDEEDIDCEYFDNGMFTEIIRNIQIHPNQRHEKKAETKKRPKPATTTTTTTTTSTTSRPSKGNSKKRQKQTKKKGADNILELEYEYNITDTLFQKVSSLQKLKEAGLTKSSKDITYFFLFCCERQYVWRRYKKLNGRKDDEEVKLSNVSAFNKYKFCNVYRELDRGTQYFHAHVNRIKEDVDATKDSATLLKNVTWASIIYRLMNRVDTFATFGGIPDMSQIKSFLKHVEKLRNNKQKVFTGQHITCGLPSYKKTCAMLPNQIDGIVQELMKAQHLEACCQALQRANGVAEFLGWQILCDLLESNVLPPRFDEDTWCQLGPGARMGISLCFQQSDIYFKPKTYLSMAIFLRKIQNEVYDALKVKFPYFIGRDMTLKNIEHALCEYQKFVNDKGNKFASRSYLDEDSDCVNCKKFVTTNSKHLCDCCRALYCFDCFDRIASHRNTDKESCICEKCHLSKEQL